jgi:energy-coupling factor transporter ATP-binding protein EcfA2
MPANEVTRLFELVRSLRASGIAVLYVSHHMQEIFDIADTVTVMRDGRHVTTPPMTRTRRGPARRVHDRAVAIVLLSTGVQGLQLVGAPVWVTDLFDGAALIAAVALAARAARNNR